MVTSSQLALLGGMPIAANIRKPAWPPRHEAMRKRLLELYDSGDWAFGMSDDLEKFSEDFARANDCEFGIFMANGTVTLMCALSALGIEPGDEVIVPAYTWLATATAVRHAGGRIVFADVEPSTLCLDPEAVEAAITDRTRAIIPVHFMGSTANMDALTDIANRYDLAIVEDCAQAHGTRWSGRSVGAIGAIGSFSFQHNKIMSSGEGGICITNDRKLATRLYQCAYIGYSPGEKFGAFKTAPPQDLLCFNFRGTQFQAALLQQQLVDLPSRVEQYSKNAWRLAQRLEQIPGVRLQSRGLHAEPQSYYKLAFIFDEHPCLTIPIENIMKAIQAEGIPVQATYGTVHEHILFQLPASEFRLPGQGVPISRAIGADRVLMLSHQWLELDQSGIDLIGDVIEKVALSAPNHLVNL